ncbi:carboxypeptidase-like regulatory domain-containing protein, partial [Escherichia coli]|nr:carboxypeptidase-like regulatory domain-containing protein [Escherichia coli]
MKITSKHRFAIFVFAAIIGLLGLFISAVAQSDSTRVKGIVTDAAGAAIPGATIKITNLKTGEERSVITRADGSYQIVQLRPAEYHLEAEASNFQSAVRESVQ